MKKCKDCEHYTEDSSEHCYMFKEEPDSCSRDEAVVSTGYFLKHKVKELIPGGINIFDYKTANVGNPEQLHQEFKELFSGKYIPDAIRIDPEHSPCLTGEKTPDEIADAMRFMTWLLENSVMPNEAKIESPYQKELLTGDIDEALKLTRESSCFLQIDSMPNGTGVVRGCRPTDVIIDDLWLREYKAEEPKLGTPPKGRSQKQHNHLMSLNKKKRR